MSPIHQLAQRLRQPSPLLLALLLATGLHLIAVALFQLRPLASDAPPPAAATDNSPELLRYSREQARQTLRPLTASTLSLPVLSNLPIPRWNDIADRNTQAQTGAADGNPQGRSNGVNTASCPGSSAHRSPKSSPAPGMPELPYTLLARLQTLLRDNPSSTPMVDGLPPVQRPQGELRSTLLRLWERSTPIPVADLPAGLPAGLEAHRLALSAARSLGLETGDLKRQVVLLGDRLLLLWPQGDQLWLVQTLVPRGTESEAPTP